MKELFPLGAGKAANKAHVSAAAGKADL